MWVGNAFHVAGKPPVELRATRVGADQVPINRAGDPVVLAAKGAVGLPVSLPEEQF
jgi:hypothetical protein